VKHETKSGEREEKERKYIHNIINKIQYLKTKEFFENVDFFRGKVLKLLRSIYEKFRLLIIQNR